MKTFAAFAAFAALAASAATAAGPRVATAPGLVVALDGSLYVEGRRIARGDQPAWSADGTRIAFVRGGSVFVTRADGRGARRLTRALDASHPSWSPDGERIVFSGGRDLYVVAVRSGRLTRLTRSRTPWLANYTPAYSPDGRLIAFSRSTDAYNNDIFLVRADGSGLRRLTTTQGSHGRLGEEHGPAWSPDGATIVFVSNRDGNFELYSIRPDGSRERRLTRTQRAAEDAPGYDGSGGLVYVRDGRVVVSRADGRGARVLGSGTAADRR